MLDDPAENSPSQQEDSAATQRLRDSANSASGAGTGSDGAGGTSGGASAPAGDGRSQVATAPGTRRSDGLIGGFPPGLEIMVGAGMPGSDGQTATSAEATLNAEEAQAISRHYGLNSSRPGNSQRLQAIAKDLAAIQKQAQANERQRTGHDDWRMDIKDAMIVRDLKNEGVKFNADQKILDAAKIIYSLRNSSEPPLNEKDSLMCAVIMKENNVPPGNWTDTRIIKDYAKSLESVKDILKANSNLSMAEALKVHQLESKLTGEDGSINDVANGIDFKDPRSSEAIRKDLFDHVEKLINKAEGEGDIKTADGLMSLWETLGDDKLYEQSPEAKALVEHVKAQDATAWQAALKNKDLSSATPEELTRIMRSANQRRRLAGLDEAEQKELKDHLHKAAQECAKQRSGDSTNPDFMKAWIDMAGGPVAQREGRYLDILRAANSQDLQDLNDRDFALVSSGLQAKEAKGLDSKTRTDLAMKAINEAEHRSGTTRDTVQGKLIEQFAEFSNRSTDTSRPSVENLNAQELQVLQDCLRKRTISGPSGTNIEGERGVLRAAEGRLARVGGGAAAGTGRSAAAASVDRDAAAGRSAASAPVNGDAAAARSTSSAPANGDAAAARSASSAPANGDAAAARSTSPTPVNGDAAAARSTSPTPANGDAAAARSTSPTPANGDAAAARSASSAPVNSDAAAGRPVPPATSRDATSVARPVAPIDARSSAATINPNLAGEMARARALTQEACPTGSRINLSELGVPASYVGNNNEGRCTFEQPVIINTENGPLSIKEIGFNRDSSGQIRLSARGSGVDIGGRDIDISPDMFDSMVNRPLIQPVMNDLGLNLNNGNEAGKTVRSVAVFVDRLRQAQTESLARRQADAPAIVESARTVSTAPHAAEHSMEIGPDGQIRVINPEGLFRGEGETYADHVGRLARHVEDTFNRSISETTDTAERMRLRQQRDKSLTEGNQIDSLMYHLKGAQSARSNAAARTGKVLPGALRAGGTAVAGLMVLGAAEQVLGATQSETKETSAPVRRPKVLPPKATGK